MNPRPNSRRSTGRSFSQRRNDDVVKVSFSPDHRYAVRNPPFATLKSRTSSRISIRNDGVPAPVMAEEYRRFLFVLIVRQQWQIGRGGLLPVHAERRTSIGDGRWIPPANAHVTAPMAILVEEKPSI